MWLVRSPLKSQDLFGDGSRQVRFSLAIDRSLLARLSILIRPTNRYLPDCRGTVKLSSLKFDSSSRFLVSEHYASAHDVS